MTTTDAAPPPFAVTPRRPGEPEADLTDRRLGGGRGRPRAALRHHTELHEVLRRADEAPPRLARAPPTGAALLAAVLTELVGTAPVPLRLLLRLGERRYTRRRDLVRG